MADPTNLTLLYSNLITSESMITVSSETTTFEKEYLVDGKYTTCWRSLTMGGDGLFAEEGSGLFDEDGYGLFGMGDEQEILIDLGTAQSINCIALGNHNLYGEVTALNLKYGDTAACADGTIDLLSSLTATDFMDFFDSISKRYLKLEMTGADTITFYQISVLSLGAYTELGKNFQPHIENYDPEYTVFEKVTPGGQIQSYDEDAFLRWKLTWGSNNGTSNHAQLAALWDIVKRDKYFWLMLDPSDSDTLKYVKVKDFNYPQIYNDHYPGHMVVEARHV